MRRASTIALAAATLILLHPGRSYGATIQVAAGGDLQAAINSAKGGDTILLTAGATYTGNFTLPSHGGTQYVTIRSAAKDRVLPGDDARISPSYASQLPKLRSPNAQPVIATQPGAAYWKLMFLEIGPTWQGYYDVVTLGDGSAAQSTEDQVPHHIILDRVYIHGDVTHGQKRGIALNCRDAFIINSYISGIRAVGQESQALGGWNGPGPFLIENNYLESAGEVIMFGGADPAIPNLIPGNIVIRRNTLTRPLAWRDPVLAAPGGLKIRTQPGGNLSAGVYAYRIVARGLANVEPTHSLASAEVSITAAQRAKIVLTWNATPGAETYDVYRRTTAGWQRLDVAEPRFTDDGTATWAAGVLPQDATVWQVKNLLELKNARRVVIERNLMTNNWASAQTGIAILFTPRNQNGTCPWCVVEDVTFDYNVVRSVAGGINILGTDDEKPSAQASNIRIRNNVFSDLGLTWGPEAGYFMLVTGAPREIVVDHNTIVSPHGIGVVAVDGTPIYGFTYTNNLARHNTYGFIGTGHAPGIRTIERFFPDGIWAQNVLAGNLDGVPYPIGFEFPSIAEFEAHFVNYPGGDYRLKAGTDWERAGTDGKDLGADFGELP